MRTTRRHPLVPVLLLLSILLLVLVLAPTVAFWGGAVSAARAADKPGPNTRTRDGWTSRRIVVTNAEFHGWKAVALRNRTAEVVVVPAIGRVMRFDLVEGDGGLNPGSSSGSGPFWNHPKMGTGGGDRVQPDSEGWTNYGGDKAWPAPQSEWPKVAGRGWPPPKGFDAMAYTATVKGDKVQLISAVDPDYGVRVRRTIVLDPSQPVMTIETTYEKVRGQAVSVGVWTITQLDVPDRLFIWLPAQHDSRAFERGYNSLLPDAPAALSVEGRLLSLGRDPRNKTMINSDGRVLLWVGSGPDLLIEDKTPAPEGSPGEWPSHGAHSQIYTSPGPDRRDPNANQAVPDQNTETYVELELLGRLNTLRPGQKAVTRTIYTLIRRTETDPAAEAKKVFAQQ